jgi:uncharacterized protein YqgC (DUF456 family)
MSPQTAGLLQLIAYAGLIAGIIGTVAPVIPGPLLIWLSALLWAWADGFHAVGWPTLVVLALLVIVAELSDVALAAMGAKKGGASWTSMVVAGIVAIIGLIFFSIPGAILGAFWGLFAWEAYRQRWQWRKAWRASSRFIIGYLIAIIVKIIFASLMIIIFIWQAFYA